MAIRRQKIHGRGKSTSKQTCQNISVLPTKGAMSRCFENYLHSIVADGNASRDTIATYSSRLKQFLAWCDLFDLYPALIKTPQIQQYRKYLIEKGLASSSISLSLIAVKHYYRACVSESLVADNPAIGVSAPKEKRVVGSTIKSLSQEQLQKVMDSVWEKWALASQQTLGLKDLRDTVLLSLMAIQGCRTIEIHRANLRDLSLVEGEVYLTVEGKTSIRKIVLRWDLAEIIKQYLLLRSETGERLFDSSPLLISLSNSHRGDRLSRRGIRYLIDNYLSQCGLKSNCWENHWGEEEKELFSLGKKRQNFSAHSLRHTAATLSLKSGASLREVQDFLGHSDPKQTAIYTSLISDADNNPANRIKITLPKIEKS